MIKLENTNIYGWNAAIRGMRNPKNSWHLSDSYWTYIENPETGNRTPFEFFMGENDLALATTLANAGTDHSKFLRMINVSVDITAPLYWWKEFDTYKVGTVANSCSTMHKIHAKEFTLDDFSHEHLIPYSECYNRKLIFEAPKEVMARIIETLNYFRALYIKTKDKVYWWQMIQLLPSSYNQKRTVQFNYQVLKNMYSARRNHKLDEWHTLCDWMEELPYFKEVCIDV